MIIGIDPGLQGAIARITPGGKFLDAHDMPTVTIKIGKRIKRIYDIVKLSEVMSQLSLDDIVYVEKTQALPPGIRVQASWGLGKCEGLLEGMLAIRKIPYEFVKPQVWQKHFGITKAKGDKKVQSYMIACQLFPEAVLATPRGRKLDGRSDALLIAEFGRRHLKGEV